MTAAPAASPAVAVQSGFLESDELWAGPPNRCGSMRAAFTMPDRKHPHPTVRPRNPRLVHGGAGRRNRTRRNLEAEVDRLSRGTR
ncbi:hypothetical protein GCM10010094_83850 [Streptomyces flaveus]|uniref:Uncharacterized protein n=1 Tax=Streptomyces flaveus TaxID=66370 RepID=A0A917VSN4_9ACTN|nr:hypothetical protein GCM10010094_83850 [Streptomyces flaveus]